MLYFGIAGGILTLLLLVAVVIYNKLVRARNLVQSAWADIDVNLQKRFSLVPQLITITKGYAEHEAVLLTRITQWRTNGNNRSEIAQQDALTSSTLHRFSIHAEAYPELKANGPFVELMEKLSGIEDHLEYARKFYNGTTRVYNTNIQSFPASIIASWFAFEAAEFYEVDAPAREVPATELH